MPEDCSWRTRSRVEEKNQVPGSAVGSNAQLMPNTGDPREVKRRLVASVVNSKLLYAAPVWTSALNNHAIQKKLFSAQRGLVLRIVSACASSTETPFSVIAESNGMLCIPLQKNTM